MSTDEIIRAWKAEDDEDEKGEGAPENPAGEQDLSDEELEEVAGGSCMVTSCANQE
jgi:mersacidin/lichenicidin family type 2 lantibiotic